VLGAALAMPAFADKPDWAGKGKGHKERDEDRDGDHERGRGGKRVEHFRDEHRVAVREYYQHEFEAGKRCPPGLAKKHNGCMPPGQAKKWHMGRPLPRDVVYYAVPHELEVRIGIPPAGYKYVRVASDILMIAAGTGIVADAIQDLGRQ
jgi:Ni/Co efflux regulator RcnB